MSDTVIKVENLSKRYTINHQRNGADSGLRHVIQNAVTAPFRKLFESQSDSSQLSSLNSQPSYEEEFWALKDVNFEVKRGDVLGVIGRNGAGKSTLLKILSRITEPTTGRVEIDGRVASLLEVGTGFHPELTGRENIFLNGAILGMSRVEIKKKFDEIVAFSEVEKFLDTPVKRYSSGMYVRLAFAVAAHLEPEILIIDEVLAVGDAAFQKKCLGKMSEVAGKGRTVLFVSHNMGAVQRLCHTALVLDQGKLDGMGQASIVIASYLTAQAEKRGKRSTRSGVADLEIQMESADGTPRSTFSIGEIIKFTILLNVGRPIRNAAFGIGIEDLMGERVVTLHTRYQHPDRWGIRNSVRLAAEWPECILCPGTYRLVSALYDGGELLAMWQDIGELVVLEADYFGTRQLPDPSHQGKVVTKAHWRIEDA